MLIDTHCHLNFKAFNSDWLEVAQRAFSHEVRGIVNVGSNLTTSRQALDLASKFKAKTLSQGKLFAAVGLHPIHATDEALDIKEYKKLARDESVVAIGETGLDLYHNPKSLSRQKANFLAFIELARAVKKPLIIHDRAAGKEIWSLLRAHRFIPKGVVHFFSEDWLHAKEIIDHGYYLSFTAAITYSDLNPVTMEVIKKAPLDRMMVETDAPFVVPEALKKEGVKRNEPAFVLEVAKRIAEVKKITLTKVADVTTANAIEFFGLK